LDDQRRHYSGHQCRLVETHWRGLDGCRDPGVNLLFDPANLETPFQGGSPRGYAWKLRAK